MTPPPVTDAVALRTARAQGLHAAARELESLHRTLLRTGEDGRGVRLPVMTLVVACASEAAADAATDVVAAIAGRHPARALLVVAGRGDPEGVDADLSLACHLVPGGQQVCAETVRLRVGGGAALHLASVVTPLLLPDVPVMLWVAGAAPLEQAMTETTLAICERVILDSAAWPEPDEPLRAVARAAEGRHALPVQDLAWLRLRPLREALARALDAAPRRTRLAQGGVTARVRGDDAAARLLCGWLADRLGVVVRREGEGRLAAVEVAAAQGALGVSIACSERSLETAVDLDGERVAARSIPRDDLELADLVGAALEADPDPVLAAAVRALGG